LSLSSSKSTSLIATISFLCGPLLILASQTFFEKLKICKNNYFNTQCSTVQPNDADYAPCFLINIIPNSVSIAGTILNSLWTFLTVWANLLDVILTPIPGGIGILIKNILIPFFGLIQATAIFVVLMKIAGIIRGGS